MLIHLIIFILKQVSKSSQTPAPQTRLQRGEKVVIHCPTCATLSLADEIFLQQRPNSTAPWTQRQHLYDCNTCHRRHPAQSFQNDGHGILTPVN